jgi:flagella basal body P-ring formation protein FlgA
MLAAPAAGTAQASPAVAARFEPADTATGRATRRDAAIADAIVRAVQARLGRDARVAVSSLSGVRLSEAGAVAFVASPEPGARLGRPVRFLLSGAQPGGRTVRLGEAVAELEVMAPVVETTRAVTRGERLGDGDVMVKQARIDAAPLRPLLSVDEARGGRATRDLGAGARITHGDVAAEPLVRAGDVVRAHARVSGLVVAADMIAAEAGNAGDLIRVVNPETKYVAKARVAARGEVEVVHVR